MGEGGMRLQRSAVVVYSYVNVIFPVCQPHSLGHTGPKMVDVSFEFLTEYSI